MTHRLTFHVLARGDLFDLYSYIEIQSGAARAGAYIERIERQCRDLETFPHRGTPRHDLAPGLRTVAMERRVLIAYRVLPGEIEILRVLYGGRDFSADYLPP